MLKTLNYLYLWYIVVLCLKCIIIGEANGKSSTFAIK